MLYGPTVPGQCVTVTVPSKPCSVGIPFTYRMGLPDGSWIMRNEMASSVETAECSFTGIRTRDKRRLPDQREGGGMDARPGHNTEGSPNLWEPLMAARGTNADSRTKSRGSKTTNAR